jgi:hypothetical protein
MSATSHGSRVSPYRYVSMEFQERRIQSGHDGRTIMIRVAQCQHGGSFLRLSCDSRISVLDNPTSDTEVRASFFFHEIGFLVEKFVGVLIELLRERVALLIDNIQETSYVHILQDHALSGVCFTSSNVVWDPGIIFSFSLF